MVCSALSTLSGATLINVINARTFAQSSEPVFSTRLFPLTELEVGAALDTSL
jgi:hypothetical protein